MSPPFKRVNVKSLPDNRIHRKSARKGKIVKPQSSSGFRHWTMNKRRGRGRHGRGNGALHGSVINTKHVYLWADMKGTKGKWYMPVTIQQLTASFQTAFDEFRIDRITITYRPNNVSTSEGLYVGVLLDQKGFGAYGIATETAWFRTLATFPGSKIRPRFEVSRYNWYPTEPDSRNWYRYQTDASHTICTLYIADNGQETAELGGVMELHVRMRARGLYYNASVKQLTATLVRNLIQGGKEPVPSTSSSVCELNMDTSSLSLEDTGTLEKSP